MSFDIYFGEDKIGSVKSINSDDLEIPYEETELIRTLSKAGETISLEIEGGIILKAQCDECGRIFEFYPKYRDITEEITEVYFECNYCETEYHSYYLTDEVKKLMNINGKLQTKIDNTNDNEIKKRKELLEEIKNNKKKIKESQKEIKNKLKGEGLINE